MPSTQISGAATRLSQPSGRAMRAATSSGWRRASCLGTSSPSTSVRNVVASTTMSSASSPAKGASVALRSNTGSSRAESRAPPKVPVTMPTSVMPTCTVGRKRCGSSARPSAAEAPRTPLRSSTVRRARRADTMAISLSANRPFIRMSSSVTPISRLGPMAHPTAPAAATPKHGWATHRSGGKLGGMTRRLPLLAWLLGLGGLLPFVACGLLAVDAGR